MGRKVTYLKDRPDGTENVVLMDKGIAQNPIKPEYLPKVKMAIEKLIAKERFKTEVNEVAKKGLNAVSSPNFIGADDDNNLGVEITDKTTKAAAN